MATVTCQPSFFDPVEETDFEDLLLSGFHLAPEMQARAHQANITLEIMALADKLEGEETTTYNVNGRIVTKNIEIPISIKGKDNVLVLKQEKVLRNDGTVSSFSLRININNELLLFSTRTIFLPLNLNFIPVKVEYTEGFYHFVSSDGACVSIDDNQDLCALLNKFGRVGLTFYGCDTYEPYNVRYKIKGNSYFDQSGYGLNSYDEQFLQHEKLQTLYLLRLVSGAEAPHF